MIRPNVLFVIVAAFVFTSCYFLFTPQSLSLWSWKAPVPAMARVSSSLNVLTSDAKSLKRLLDTGSIRSADVVDLYLSQIHKHDGYLHAMLSILSKDRLRKIALELDEERKAGKLRGPLHGIPVIVKVETLLPKVVVK